MNAVGGAAGLTIAGALAGCSDDDGTDATDSTGSSPASTPSSGSAGPGTTPSSTAGAATTTPTSTTLSRSGGTLRVAIVGGGTSDTVDPNNLVNTPDYARSLCLFEYLTFRDYDWQAFNLLAESVEMGATADLWTIRLRDGVEFHNGKTLDADDVLFSFQRVFNPDAPGLAYPALKDYVDPSKITKLDERTLSLELLRPYSILPQSLGIGIPIIPVDFDPANPVGTGPWKFVEFIPGDRSRFAWFENYWDGPALTDELEIINFADSAAASNAIQAQQVDIIAGIDFSQKATLEAAGINMLTTELNGFTPFVMNTAVAPFDDPRVREAFRLIVDREQMVEQVLSGYGRVANDLYSPTDPAYLADVPQRAQDIDRAKELLTEAGQDGLTLDLASVPVDPAIPAMVQVFAEQAKDAGVTITVQSMTPDQFFSTVYFQAPFQPDFWANSPYMTITAIGQIEGGIYNSGNFNDPELADLYEQVLVELDEAKRIELMRQMQQLQYERGNFIVWGFSDGFDAMAPNVTGYVNGTRSVFNVNDYDFHRFSLD
jgi:peptide/nickel transport system substrate-binding protein